MARCQLTDQADLGVMFDAEKLLYSPELLKVQPDSRERFVAFYTHCRSVGYQIDGIAVGGAIFDGKEFHLAILPHYFGRWTWLLEPTLKWLFEMADPVCGRIAKTNRRALQFADKSKFPRVHEDDEYVTYELGSKYVSYQLRTNKMQFLHRSKPATSG